MSASLVFESVSGILHLRALRIHRILPGPFGSGRQRWDTGGGGGAFESQEFLGKSIWEKNELFRWYLSDPFSLGLSIPESCFGVNLHRLAPHWKSWWLHTSFNLYCTSCSISLHCLIPFLPKWVHSRWQRTTWSGSCRLSAMSDRLRSVRFRKHIVERFKTPWTLLGPNPRNVGTFRST